MNFTKEHTTVRNPIRVLALVAVSLILGSCGIGGSGGSAGIGSFQTTISRGTTSWASFFSTGTYYRWQYLYLSSEIHGAGTMSGLAIQYLTAVPSDVSCPNVTIKLSHSNLANLGSTFASNVNTGQGSQVTVSDNATITFPAGGAGSWHVIPFNSPFEYNGKDNLVAEFERASPCSTTIQPALQTGWPYTAVNYSSTFGSATGTATTWAFNAKFVFDGGDDTVVYPVTTNDTAPFSISSAWHHLQVLYKAGDIDGAGPITGIGIISTEAPTDAATYTVNVRMAHTTLTALTDTFDSNYSGKLTTVAKNATFTVPAGVPVGTPIWLPVNGSFRYNGSDNLLLDIEVLSGSTTTEWAMDDTTNPGSRAYGTVGATTGYTSAGSYHTVFRFNGAPVYVLTDEAASTGLAFSTAAAGRLNLYRASELGSAGKIRSVACRLAGPSNAGDFANYEVIIGHSDVDTLSATSVDNFVSQKTVYSGTVSVPAGLLAGDWIDIPLSKPFAYDGHHNLVVWMGTTAVPGVALGNSCLVSSADATHYPGHMAQGIPGAASVLPQNYKFDMKLDLSK